MYTTHSLTISLYLAGPEAEKGKTVRAPIIYRTVLKPPVIQMA